MKEFLDKIRTPKKRVSLKIQIIATIGIMLIGLALGVLQKWMDESGRELLPLFLQQLDIANYFGGLAIWILLGTVISVYAKTPLRASINTFLFFISMLAGYYLYCNYVLGFLPVAYMMMWIKMAIASFFIAFICWYAKGKGKISIIISSVIIATLFLQAFTIIQGFRVTFLLEVITWCIGIIVLYRKPNELAMELGLSLVIAFVHELVFPYWY